MPPPFLGSSFAFKTNSAGQAQLEREQLWREFEQWCRTCCASLGREQADGFDPVVGFDRQVVTVGLN